MRRFWISHIWSYVSPWAPLLFLCVSSVTPWSFSGYPQNLQCLQNIFTALYRLFWFIQRFISSWGPLYIFNTAACLDTNYLLIAKSVKIDTFLLILFAWGQVKFAPRPKKIVIFKCLKLRLCNLISSNYASNNVYHFRLGQRNFGKKKSKGLFKWAKKNSGKFPKFSS